jgi:hypothetical protein
MTQILSAIPQRPPLSNNIINNTYNGTKTFAGHSWRLFNGGLRGMSAGLKVLTNTSNFIAVASIRTNILPALARMSPGLRAFAYNCAVTKALLGNFYIFRDLSGGDDNDQGRLIESNNLISIANRVCSIFINMIVPVRAVINYLFPSCISALRQLSSVYSVTLLTLLSTSAIKYLLKVLECRRKLSDAREELTKKYNALPVAFQNEHFLTHLEGILEGAKNDKTLLIDAAISSNVESKDISDEYKTLLFAFYNSEFENRETILSSLETEGVTATAIRDALESEIGRDVMARVEATLGDTFQRKKALIIHATRTFQDIPREIPITPLQERSIVAYEAVKEKISKYSELKTTNWIALASTISTLAVSLLAKYVLTIPLVLASVAFVAGILGVYKWNRQHIIPETVLLDELRPLIMC